jgi:YidC/Oxa1 family membrane protein insertase
MQFFYLITRSWAASIILLTIALRVMMYPLNSWSIKSQVKMQQISPKVKAIQERYKNDPKRGQLEIMNLYRESGVNPITGCLPVLLQMPFLIGMFYLLKSSFPLRGAVFIPGWIDDLATPDVLFTWGPRLWFIGNEFHLLPILMGLSMYLQQRLTSKLPKDPSQMDEAQKQQKMMGNMMSILFVVMFYNFPSGLNIYFMFSTLLGIAQQYWMTKKMNPAK